MRDDVAEASGSPETWDKSGNQGRAVGQRSSLAARIAEDDTGSAGGAQSGGQGIMASQQGREP
jgi:hypothetical protein